MKTLYLGDGPCFRQQCLRKIGHDVCELTQSNVFSSLVLRLISTAEAYIGKCLGTPYRLLSDLIIKFSLHRFLRNNTKFDLIFINQAVWVSPAILKLILSHSSDAKICIFANDDITGFRDKNRFQILLSCIPYVDLWLVCREVNVIELYSLGAKKAIRIWMGFSEDIHLPVSKLPLPTNINVDPLGKIIFIGTNIAGEHRVQFLTNIIKSGIPLVVIGQRWNNLILPRKLKSNFVNSLVNGLSYSYYLHSCLAVLGLLSHGNRDLHTTRTFECIAAEGCFVGERTSEHQLLYEDKYEAFFWSNEEECLSILSRLTEKYDRIPFSREFIVSNASKVNLFTYELSYVYSRALAELSRI